VVVPAFWLVPNDIVVEITCQHGCIFEQECLVGSNRSTQRTKPVLERRLMTLDLGTPERPT
jgi:hypothetical protein